MKSSELQRAARGGRLSAKAEITAGMAKAETTIPSTRNRSLSSMAPSRQTFDEGYSGSVR